MMETFARAVSGVSAKTMTLVPKAPGCFSKLTAYRRGVLAEGDFTLMIYLGLSEFSGEN